MKRYKPLITVFLAVSCLGILLSGCGTDDQKMEVPNVGQEITEADLQTSSPAPEQGASRTPAADNSAADTPDTVDSPADTQNEPESTASLYEQFLYSDLAASVGTSYPQEDYRTPIVESGNSYTLSELGKSVSAYFLDPESTDKTSYDYVQYTYVTCPDSPDTARQNLLLKFVGLNIYAPDDDSYAVFVLSENDGQLYITYEYECWARSASTAYKNGLLGDFGSAGAGDHYDGLSAILSDGSSVSIYSAEILSGWWTNWIAESIYNEVFGENIEVNLEVSIYTIGDDQYYLYNMDNCSEEEIPLWENYIERCQSEAGINWITEEELQTAVHNRCSALGIDYNIIQSREETSWSSL